MEIIDCIQPSTSVYSFSPAESLSLRKVKSFILRCICTVKDRKAEILELRKYWWVIPFAFSLAFVPKTVYKAILSWEATARNITIPAVSVSVQTDAVEQAMSEFASNQVSLIDSEGNLLSESGLPLKNEISCRTKVTFRKYTVRKGESVSSITKKFGLGNMSTVIAVNGISNARSLRSGQTLMIPSMDGLYHTIVKGDTLDALAKSYGVARNDLLDVNDLSTDTLTIGERLYIPGARLDSNTLKKAMGELFMKPITAAYRVTDAYGPRIDPIAHVRKYHTGIDLACPAGTAIHPAMSGKVSKTGWSSVFGNYVIVQHIDGYQTLYAHMSKISCRQGDAVDHSSVIGKVGSTGYSTGNHLHFTVYKNGKLINPESVVKLR